MRIGFTGTQMGMTVLQKRMLYFITTPSGMIYPNHKKFVDSPVNAPTLHGESEFHHGDCIGADEESHHIVRIFSPHTSIFIHPPIKENKRANTYNRLAPNQYLMPLKDYLDRNKDIVDDTEILIGTPEGMEEVTRSGTWSTIRYAMKQKHPVFIIYPDGSVETR